MTFYTNDSADPPPLPIQEPNEETICCVHGLASLNRWLGSETFHRTELQGTSIIFAYNLFMNAVDRLD